MTTFEEAIEALRAYNTERETALKSAQDAAKDYMAQAIELTAANERLSQQLVVAQEKNVQLKGLYDGALANIAQLKADLAKLFPMKFGDATRKLFLGAAVEHQCPGSYESEFYPATMAQAARPLNNVSRSFVLNTTMPKWRARYPNALFWWADIEWQNPGGVTAQEVSRILPAWQGARDFALAEGKGLQLGGYGFPPRFGIHKTDAEVMAQVDIVRPILDLCDYVLLTLYPIYSDLEKTRVYIRRNVALARRAMPNKRIVVLGWDTWHDTVGAPLAGTPVSREWQRVFLDELLAAGVDVYAPWLMAAAPQPTNEPWWLETQAWKKEKGLV
jgi:hypothetical protein